VIDVAKRWTLCGLKRDFRRNQQDIGLGVIGDKEVVHI
jgi:hypothetical protein